MPVRPNILTNATARTQYVNGVIALKNQFTGVTTTSLGIPGPNRPVSTWDRFVAWHHAAMGIAHSRPIFLPWHRLMLRTLEQLIAQAVNNPNFGLPYWDWAADGQRTPAQQLASAIWNNNCMGSASSAPGAFTLAAFPVRIEAGPDGAIRQTNHALQRTRGVEIATLPDRSDTAGALAVTPYDSPAWNRFSPGFRSHVEGWQGATEPELHNRVHVWVGGDMLPSSSPNDPVFYLNHCNEDRIWEAWMVARGRTYRPLAGVGPVGQRINSPMVSPFGASRTPAQVLNMTAIYTYDSLSV